MGLQLHSEISGSAPFLVLNEKKKMMMFPLTFLPKESPDPANADLWKDVPRVSTENEISLGKWIHVGCEVHFKHLLKH